MKHTGSHSMAAFGAYEAWKIKEDGVLMAVCIPEKLSILFKPKRYKVLYGGRGGGKSHNVAVALLILAAQKKLRILCAREVQKSMRDSVHRLLKDKVAELGLEDFYAVHDFEIRGVNGSLFVFSGLQVHTIDSIKSFEGIDIVWIEEAHGVSKRSWDVLIPTIRKEGSEIWMTLNPNLDTDETYKRFILNESDDTYKVKINYNDNPFFPDTLDKERIKNFKTMPKEDYENIWEGKVKNYAYGAIYGNELAQAFDEGRIGRVEYDNMNEVHTVWDLGWNDSMSILLIQKDFSEIRVIDYIEDSHRTLDYYVNLLHERPYRYGYDYLPHDAMIRNYQTGKSTEDVLRGFGRNVYVQKAGSVEEGIRQARMLFAKCRFDKVRCERLIECLRRYRRNINSKTGEAFKPLHDEYSHGADAFRYLAGVADIIPTHKDTEYIEDGVGDWRL